MSCWVTSTVSVWLKHVKIKCCYKGLEVGKNRTISILCLGEGDIYGRVMGMRMFCLWFNYVMCYCYVVATFHFAVASLLVSYAPPQSCFRCSRYVFTRNCKLHVFFFNTEGLRRSLKRKLLIYFAFLTQYYLIVLK